MNIPFIILVFLSTSIGAQTESKMECFSKELGSTVVIRSVSYEYGFKSTITLDQKVPLAYQRSKIYDIGPTPYRHDVPGHAGCNYTYWVSEYLRASVPSNCLTDDVHYLWSSIMKIKFQIDPAAPQNERKFTRYYDFDCPNLARRSED